MKKLIFIILLLSAPAYAGVDIYGGGELRFYESTNTDYVGFKAGVLSGSQIWFLPLVDATVNGQALRSNAAGVLRWGDHGDGAGLGDDDHTIYSLADGTRDFTGVVVGVTPTASAHLTTKEYVDTAVAGLHFDMFLDDLDSTINDPCTAEDYYSLQTTETGAGVSTLPAYAALGQGDDQEVLSYISGASLPFAELQAGLIQVHIHARKDNTGQKDTILFGKLYHRASGGTETLIATTEDSDDLTNAFTSYNLHGTIVTTVAFSATDRLLLKIRADVQAAGGGNAAIEIRQEGEEASRVSALVDTDTLSDIFLRQDGTKPLTANWEAGAVTITANGLTLDDPCEPITLNGQTLIHNDTSFIFDDDINVLDRLWLRDSTDGLALISVFTGDLVISTATTDRDINFQAEDGGVTKTSFFIDGSGNARARWEEDGAEPYFKHGFYFGASVTDAGLFSGNTEGGASRDAFIGNKQVVIYDSAPPLTADNFTDGGGNAIITTTQETNFEAAFTHVSNNGTDHSYIDQDVTTSGTPVFSNVRTHANAITTGSKFSYKTAAFAPAFVGIYEVISNAANPLPAATETGVMSQCSFDPDDATIGGNFQIAGTFFNTSTGVLAAAPNTQIGLFGGCNAVIDNDGSRDLPDLYGLWFTCSNAEDLVGVDGVGHHDLDTYGMFVESKFGFAAKAVTLKADLNNYGAYIFGSMQGAYNSTRTSYNYGAYIKTLDNFASSSGDVTNTTLHLNCALANADIGGGGGVLTSWGIYQAGDVMNYFEGDISAKDITDRASEGGARAWEGTQQEALAAVCRINSDYDHVENASLPEFVRRTIKKEERYNFRMKKFTTPDDPNTIKEREVYDVRVIEEEGRSLGGMVTVLTEAVKELKAKDDAQDVLIAELAIAAISGRDVAVGGGSSLGTLALLGAGYKIKKKFLG